ncbi:glutamate racemase [Candidatus Liberibacter asiaticus]|uniref:Glutamate racemase n=2 Tax=Liberibacter asiaticus TaxID=34021 RepID=C6XG75_LIBAP|nr:glutamate racemase [Candidatus Liberibacter asiaticus]ACT57378.1 glutamate racemase [Candidatus Liberibacter asiaticus str. psy62]AGH17141.1 glutamate racemase [Candidatus Liberibacter asiaticus str. gxpsy]ALK07450.1 glutamate racemase [Candidatus Liberibacter asiaticus]ASK52942.1 glutamate racemase [Candidatus Liberibacter asiaticus]AWL14264.1 glutamate racemase [Candidatus Liberibacter asiaticus]
MKIDNYPCEKKLQNSILIFDSGIGGLIVLQKMRFLMPEYHFIYVADDVGFPYGNWEDHALKKRLMFLFSDILDKYQPVLSVIACNTAFTLIKDELRSTFPSMAFLGAVPAIKQAAAYTQSGLISILSTPATLRRTYTSNLIHSYVSQCHIHLVSSMILASRVEEYACGIKIKEDEIKKEIEGCFIEKEGKRTDVIVLACTHYPLIVHVFRQLSPWPVDWLDNSDSIARRARCLLPRINTHQTRVFDDHALFLSGKPDIAMRRLMQGFGLKS